MVVTLQFRGSAQRSGNYVIKRRRNAIRLLAGVHFEIKKKRKVVPRFLPERTRQVHSIISTQRLDLRINAARYDAVSRSRSIVLPIGW